MHQHLSTSEDDGDVRNIFAKFLPHPLRDFLLRHYALQTAKCTNLLHGNAVAYLLASDTPVNASLKGEIALLLPVTFTTTKWAKWLHPERKMSKMIAKLPLPRVINCSLRFGKSNFRSKVIASTIKPIAGKTIFVTSAGNDASDAIEAGKSKLAKQLIIVGSADPTGHVSSFSQTGYAETIRAGSDKYLQNINPQSGEFFNFGGTSGAAALVSAAIADMLSILPDLSLAHAKLLLQNTALANSYGNAVGLLNYFKLLRVAHRLAKRGWSSSFGAEEVLHDRALYDFKAEAEQLTQEAISATSNDTAFLKLRQAFFLNHDSPMARTLLVERYHQHGYEAQALFYDNSTPKARTAFFIQKDTELQANMDKFLAATAVEDTQTMVQLLSDPHGHDFLWKEDFWKNLIPLSPKKLMMVLDFLEEYEIADITFNKKFKKKEMVNVKLNRFKNNLTHPHFSAVNIREIYIYRDEFEMYSLFLN